MVHHAVKDEFQSFLPAFISQFFVLFHSTKAGIHFIIIRYGITVIGRLLHIIFQQGCGPDGGETHTGYIIEAVDDATDIAAMTAIVILAVDPCFPHSTDHIIAYIAIGETIGSDEINNIRCCKTL